MDNKAELRKRIYKLSIICLVIAVVLFVASYFVFHYVTDSGFTAIKQEEAGKPFVTNVVGWLATNFLFGSAISALIAKIVIK